MRENIHDGPGNIIAWVDDSCEGSNDACIKARRQGRRVHIIPAHTDPRAENHRLALPTYHYATRNEAVMTLDIAWETAIEVDNPSDRDAAYARRVPVKIRKNTGNFGGPQYCEGCERFEQPLNHRHYCPDCIEAARRSGEADQVE